MVAADSSQFCVDTLGLVSQMNRIRIGKNQVKKVDNVLVVLNGKSLVHSMVPKAQHENPIIKWAKRKPVAQWSRKIKLEKWVPFFSPWATYSQNIVLGVFREEIPMGTKKDTFYFLQCCCKKYILNMKFIIEPNL